MLHLHNAILLACNKEENLTCCDSMNGPGENYALENNSVRERQIPYDFTYMCNLKNSINEQNKNKLLDTEHRLTVARRSGGGTLRKS